MTAPHNTPKIQVKTYPQANDIWQHGSRLEQVLTEYHEDNFNESQYEVDGMEQDIEAIECLISNNSGVFSEKYLKEQIKQIKRCIKIKKEATEEYYKGQDY